MHYKRLRRHGDVMTTLRRQGSAAQRFAASYKVDESGCWSWQQQARVRGYGYLWDGRRMVLAHRYSYALHVGPIPSTLVLDHTCHDPKSCKGGETCPHRACVNPAHLEPVTSQENTARGAHKGKKTHCPKGHPYAGENLYLVKRSDGGVGRVCRICRDDSRHRMRARQREARAAAIA